MSNNRASQAGFRRPGAVGAHHDEPPPPPPPSDEPGPPPVKASPMAGSAKAAPAAAAAAGGPPPPPASPPPPPPGVLAGAGQSRSPTNKTPAPSVPSPVPRASLTTPKSPTARPSGMPGSAPTPTAASGKAAVGKDHAPPPPDGPPPEADEEEDEEDDDDDGEDEEEEGAEPPPPDRDASYYVSVLHNPKSITQKDIQELRQMLSTDNREWKNDFIQQDGLEAFAALLAKNTQLNAKVKDDVTHEILACLENLLSEVAWLTPMLFTQGLLNNIVEKVGSDSQKTRIKAMQLLTVICWMHADGRRSVFTAMDPSAQASFHGLTHLIKQLKSFDVKQPDATTITMILVNSLINSAAALEERLDARKRLTDLGIFDAIGRLNTTLDQHNDPRFSELASQLDEYDSALLRDQRETLRDGCDLSDPDAVYQYVKKSAGEDGFGPGFLSVLQMMMTISNDREQGSKIWENLQYIVQLTVMKEDVKKHGEKNLVSFERLKKALLEKEAQTEKESSSRLKSLEDKVEEQRAELHTFKMKAKYAEELKSKLVAAQSELVALRDRLKRGGGGGGGAPSLPSPVSSPAMASHSLADGAGGGGADSEELKRLNDVIAEKDARIAELEAKLGGEGGAIPEPPPPDGDVPEAPSFGDGPPEAPSLDDGDGPPAAPSLDDDGVPGAPSFDLEGGLEEAPTSRLPKKRVIKPKQKMKKLHWQTVDDKMVKASIWWSIKDDDVKFDVDEFEATFCQREAKEKKVEEKQEVKKKAEVVKLVDEKRSYNCDITLARFRMTHAFIRDAILAMEETQLDQDKLMQLIKIAPTADEVETVSGYTGDVNALGNTEKFYRCIATIPRIERRLEYMLFKQQFQGQYQGFKEHLKHICDAIEQLKTSKNLKAVLQITLAFGNYMNGGTPHGGAYGFKLSTLNRLDSSKSSDNQTSLLHYLADYVQTKQPAVRVFLDECSAVHEACRVEAAWLQAEIQKVVGIVGRIGVELEKSEESIIDRFVPVMREFHTKASAKIKKAQKKLEQANEDYKNLLQFYGEGNDKLQWEEFFLIFDRFFKQYKVAEEQLADIREKKAKAEKVAAYKEKMKQEQEEKKKAKKEGKDGAPKKKKKKEKLLVNRVMSSLRNRRDSEFIRQQSSGEMEKVKKMKKDDSSSGGGGGGKKKKAPKDLGAMADAIAAKLPAK